MKEQTMTMKQEAEERRIREVKIQKEKEILAAQRKSGDRRIGVRTSIVSHFNGGGKYVVIDIS